MSVRLTPEQKLRLYTGLSEGEMITRLAREAGIAAPTVREIARRVGITHGEKRDHEELWRMTMGSMPRPEGYVSKPNLAAQDPSAENPRKPKKSKKSDELANTELSQPVSKDLMVALGRELESAVDETILKMREEDRTPEGLVRALTLGITLKTLLETFHSDSLPVETWSDLEKIVKMARGVYQMDKKSLVAHVSATDWSMLNMKPAKKTKVIDVPKDS
jgi:hypothetical protein